MKICGCGHDLDKHPDRGPCVVCARSATPDKCPGYHSRRSSGRRVFPVPSENGPLLHQTPLERIARSLERIAAALERGAPVPEGFRRLKTPIVIEPAEHVGPSLNGKPMPVRKPTVVEHAGRYGEPIPKGHRRILESLARYGECSKAKLAILARYAANGGGFNNYLSALRNDAYLTGERDGPYAITSGGLHVLGSFDPLPANPDQLFADWMRHPELGKAHREIMSVLKQNSRTRLSKEAVAYACNPPYEPNGGGFNNAVSRLRTLGIVEGKNEIRLTEELR
jgi:hypothetical protein